MNGLFYPPGPEWRAISSERVIPGTHSSGITRGAMDNATHEALLNLLRNLRQVADEQSHVNEMVWRMYSALQKMFPGRFLESYQGADSSVEFQPMGAASALQLQRLDAAILLVESWKASRN